MSRKNVKLKVESGKWWTLLLLSIFHFPLSIFNSSAYEVTSLSTESSPTFIETQDGPADLTYPVESEDTFGSPDWYEESILINVPRVWRMICDGNTVSNTHGSAILPYDRRSHLLFDFPPTYTWPERWYSDSEWYVEWDLMMAAYDYLNGAWFPDRDMNEFLRFDSPYEPNYRFPLHDITGPGCIEMDLIYTATNGNEVTKSVTLFPFGEPGYYDGREFLNIVYPNPPVEIWLPKFQRLTPASRSALMAAYEAYFERMYWASRGDTGEGEDTSEWEALGLASFEKLHTIVPGPGFLFNPADPTAGWCQDFPLKGFADYDLRTPCRLTYPDSAFHIGFQNLRRSYPSGCMRTLDETEHIRRLCTGVRSMFAADIATGRIPFDPGRDGIPLDSRVERSFLCRPQWILDGRVLRDTVVDLDIIPASQSHLWWSTTLRPVEAWQLCENIDKIGQSDFDLDYFARDGELGNVLNPVDVFSFYDGVKDYAYNNWPAMQTAMRNLKPFLQTFTLDMLAAADGEFSPRGIPDYGEGWATADEPLRSPFCVAMLHALDSFSREHYDNLHHLLYDFMHGYDVSGKFRPDPVTGLDKHASSVQTVTGLIATNVVQSFRSLPDIGDSVGRIVGEFDRIERGGPSAGRIDSAPVALASQVLAIADRTILFPQQALVYTNVPNDATSGGNYVWTPGGEYIDIALREQSASTGGEFPGFVVDGDATASTTFSAAKTNDLTSVRPFFPGATVNPYVIAAATTPTGYAVGNPGPLSDLSLEDPPDKAFEVGELLEEYDSYTGSVRPAMFSGRFAAGGFWYGSPDRELRYGLFCTLTGRYGTYGYATLYLPTKYPTERLPRIRAGVGAVTPFDCTRTYSLTLPGLAGGGSVLTGAVYPSRGAPEDYATYGVGAVAMAGISGETYVSRDYGFSPVPHAAAVFVGEPYTGLNGTLAETRRQVAWCLSETEGMAKGLLRDSLVFDPEVPPEFAPVPPSFTVRETVRAEDGDGFEFVIGQVPDYHVETFPTGETVHEYAFQTTTSAYVGGSVDTVCTTSRTDYVHYWVSEQWVRQPSESEYRLGSAYTNVFAESEWPGYATYATEDHRTYFAQTGSVLRTAIDDGDLKPFWYPVHFGYEDRVTYDATIHRLAEYTIERTYYVDIGGTWMYERTDPQREDRQESDVPWGIPQQTTVVTEMVLQSQDLQKSDAISHRSYPKEDLYRYGLELFVDRGVVKKISFYPVDGGPDIDDVDRYHVAGIGFDETVVRNYLTSHAVFGEIRPAPDGDYRGERGHIEVKAGLGVLNWADWKWNALRLEPTTERNNR